MRRAAALLAVLALAGCGGGSKGTDEFGTSALGLSMAEGAVYNAYAAGDMRLTYRRSRALASAVESRVSDGDLQADEGARKLQRVSDDLRLDCPECSTVLDRAADSLG